MALLTVSIELALAGSREICAYVMGISQACKKLWLFVCTPRYKASLLTQLAQKLSTFLQAENGD